MSAVRAPMLALGAVQGRDSPANGPLRAGRRPSRPHSGRLRAFRVPGYTPGYPLKHPSTPIPGAAGSPAITTPTLACLAGSVRSASNTDVLVRRAATPRGLAEPASEPPVAFEDCSGRSGSVSAVRAPMLALGAVQGRDSPANGPLRAGRRPSRPHSGRLRAFRVPGYTPGYPLKHPSTSLSSTASSAAAVTSPRTCLRLLGGTGRAPSKPGRSDDKPAPGAPSPRSDPHRPEAPQQRPRPPRPLDRPGFPGPTFPLKKSQTSAVTCPPKRDNSSRRPVPGRGGQPTASCRSTGSDTMGSPRPPCRAGCHGQRQRRVSTGRVGYAGSTAEAAVSSGPVH